MGFVLTTLFTLAVLFQSNADPIPLKGKTVLVTGASSGIGETISREFAAKGLNVVLAARRKENLDRILAEIKQAGGSAIAVQTDVGSKESVANAFKVAEEAFGPVHFTVANAAIAGPATPIESEQSLVEFESLFQSSLLGVVYTLREGVISSRKSGGGAIVLVSSPVGCLSSFYFTKGGIQPTTKWLSYGSAKAAVDSLARTSAGFSKENIRVYAISPFIFVSEMTQGAAKDLSLTMDQIAGLFNPLFPNKAGNPRDLVPVLTSIFDNSTLYKPGDVIYCDNHVTFDDSVIYPQIPLDGPLKVTREQARDFQGKPYVWPEEKPEL